MNLLALNLLVLRSTDIERAAQFYSCLGISFIKHRHGTGPEHYAAEIGSLVFELYPAQTLPDPAALIRLGFQVSNLDLLVTQLSALGARVLTPPRESPWGRRAVIADLDGYRVELTERS